MMIFPIGLLALLLLVISLRYHWWRMPISVHVPRVLMYHSISNHGTQRNKNKWRVRPEDFEQQLAWFAKNGWQSFTISELVSQQSCPPKSFCITFDDGFEDNYIQALPVLEKYQFKATIYLVGDQQTNHWEAYDDGKFARLLSDQDIKMMLATGLIEFGAHTLSHCNLLTVSDQMAEKEVFDCKKVVEQRTGQACLAFAYPYGKYHSALIKRVEKAGYCSATTVDRGFYQQGAPFAIKRIGILGTESFFDFYLKVTRIRNKI